MSKNNDDEDYVDKPIEPKKKRGRPKGSTKTTNKKPKAELSEGEIKIKMGRAWYAVNDEKREFRFFTGLLEGEIPCSKQEEREAKLRLNGYTRILSNGKSKIAIFEDVDKEQEIQTENPNFEQIYGNQAEYPQEYNNLYQNADFQNYQKFLYQQQLYQQENYNNINNINNNNMINYTNEYPHQTPVYNGNNEDPTYQQNVQQNYNYQNQEEIYQHPIVQQQYQLQQENIQNSENLENQQEIQQEHHQQEFQQEHQQQEYQQEHQQQEYQQEQQQEYQQELEYQQDYQQEQQENGLNEEHHDKQNLEIHTENEYRQENENETDYQN